MLRNIPTNDMQAALAFVVTQATVIETAVNEIVYGDIQYPGLVPVDTSAAPFTQSVLYYSSDKYGKANWINGNSDDIPMAGTELEMAKTPVYTAAIGYGFGWEEVNYAMLIGQNIQSADAAAARRAYEEMVDDVALRGDTRKGFSGLINYPTVPIIASSGVWTGLTPAQIVGDLNRLIFGVAQATNYTSMANTLLLSPDRLSYIASTPVNDNTMMTILQWFMTNNAYSQLSGAGPVTVQALRGLETAGATSNQRAVAYRRSPDVLKFHLPMPHRFLPVFQDGPLHWVVPGVFRLGGLDVRKPTEMRYMDGI